MPELKVLDHGEVIAITFDDILKYHGRQFIGGVAHGFKVMERGFELLSPDAAPDRYALAIHTAFPGPGARDAFEMVTRAVTGGRYRVEPDIAPPRAIESAAGGYFFRFGYRGATADLLLRPGIVREEFILLSRKKDRTGEENRRLDWLKTDMANRIMALPAADVYESV